MTFLLINTLAMTVFTRLRRFFHWAALVALTLGVAGCSFTTPQSSLDPKGPVAHVQLELFYLTVWVCLGIFIVVGGALVWVVWRFRERPGDENKPMPSQGHGNPLIEIGLIGASIFLLVIIAIPTLRAIWFTHELPEDQPYYEESKLGNYLKANISSEEEDNVLEINVYGWQWWFAFEYPQLGFSTANEFVIPKGKVVKFNLRGVDVIHSFWLPKLAGKVDLMPGRKNWMWLMADEEGYYFGQCAEFCGEAHAYMLFRAEVVSDEEFNAWVDDYQQGAPAPGGYKAEPTADKPKPTHQDDWAAWAKANVDGALPDNAVNRGAQIFMGKGKCLVCHAIDSSTAGGATAPNLTKVAQRKSLAAGILNHYTDGGAGLDPTKQAENFEEWIKHSHFYKPGNLMYYRSDAGLIDLQYSGLSYANLEKVGITDKNLTSAGVSQEQLAKLKANPNAPFSSIVSDQAVLRGIVESVEEGKSKDERAEALQKLSEVSDWLTDQEVADLRAFLMTLK